MKTTGTSHESSHRITAPTESTETGKLVMVTARTDISQFRNNPRFIYRVEITLPYQPDASGMPPEDMAETLGDITDALEEAFAKDPVAVTTGIYTGDGRRDWICYTLSLHIFQKKINQALASLPLLPLEFHAEEDPEWQEYDNMLSIVTIPDDDDNDDAGEDTEI